MAIRLPLLAKPDRRRWKRYWFSGSVRVSSGSRRIDGLGIQVSRGGMYLFAVADLPIGADIRVAFTEPGSQRLVEVPGTVRNRAVYLYGVEFLPQRDQADTVDDFDAIPNQESASS
jgi:PilZ domain